MRVIDQDVIKYLKKTKIKWSLIFKKPDENDDPWSFNRRQGIPALKLDVPFAPYELYLCEENDETYTIEDWKNGEVIITGVSFGELKQYLSESIKKLFTVFDIDYSKYHGFIFE